jgi:DNA processing protein
MSTRDVDGVTDDRSARMALACTSEPADRTLGALVAAEGAEAVWRSLAGGRVATPWGRRRPGVRLGVVRGLMERHRLRYVVPGDPEWPEQLDVLDHVTMKEGGGRPLGLWVAGPGHLAEWSERAVAIVGSRACTRYGETVSVELAADLAACGWVVVSGAAYGVDVAAHRGAVTAGGGTIGVVASGADVSYPRGNARLIETLRAGHLVVSELPPGSHPSRPRFLTRNRVIAALSVGTVVVEAAVRSGALNTAAWARECGRYLMAVPGPVTSQFSQGTHELIRKDAELVTHAGQIRELVAPMGQDTLPIERGPGRPTDRLDELQRTVFELVPGRGGIAAGEIAVRAGLDLPNTINALGELVDLGLIVENERGWKLKSGAVG